MPEDPPINLRNMQILEIEGLDVVEWHSLPDGRGRPEQVHILSNIKGSKVKLVMRLKSRRILDELVAALIEHGDAVWPK